MHSKRLSAIFKFIIFWVMVATTSSVSATTRCPPEFGEKSNSFMLLGWFVASVFLLVGITLPVLATKKSRGIGLLKRSAFIAVAVVLMALIWLAGLSVFVGFFVMAC
jgi:hypothetical protein